MRNINRNIALGTGLMGLGLALSVAAPASAAPRRHNDVREERREVKGARREVKDERRDLQRARTEAQRREEARELAAAQARLRRERQDVREERRENRRPTTYSRPPYGNAYGYRNNRPVYRPNYNYNRNTYRRNAVNSQGYRNGQQIAFPGIVTNNVNGTSSFYVRGDNGITYRVQPNGYIRLRAGERVRVTGTWSNGMVINPGVNRI